MSGGGRRGEIRIRKARPVEKQAGGTHNRKARRAGKARPPERSKPPEDAADFIRRREARRRAEREAFWASKTEADVEAMALEQSERESGALGGQWFLPLLLDAVPRWATRHFTTDPDARVKRAHDLGENIIACSQGAAAVADQDARGTAHEGDVAEIFNAIAEGLALGAYCPGGTPGVSGMKWEVVGNELRVTHGRFCARYPVNDPGYWDTEPCSNLIEATIIYAAEAQAR